MDEDQKENVSYLVKFFKNGHFMIAVFLILVCALSFPFLNKGYASYKDIISKPATKPVYQNVSSTEFPGFVWARNFVSTKPEGVGEWNVQDSSLPRNPLPFEVCSSLGKVPSLNISTHSASGSGFSIYAQVYGAGQGKTQYKEYNNLLEKCADIEKVENWNDTGIDYTIINNSIVASAGDAIIGLTAPSKKVLDSSIDGLLNRFQSSLSESKCVSVAESVEDSKRSFFYNPKDYTGLYGSTKVDTKVKTDAFSTPVSIDLATLNDPYPELPEAPLPEGFPTTLPNEVERPVSSSEPEKGNYSSVAKYLIPDDEGPGCGWEWSGQKSPYYNREKLQKDQDDKVDALQKEMDTKAQDYVTSRNKWGVDYLNYLSLASSWNDYVKAHNEITGRWELLEEQRKEFKPVWDAWVEDYEKWKSFPSRQEKARKKYESELKVCRDDREAYKKWDEQYGEQWRAANQPGGIQEQNTNQFTFPFGTPSNVIVGGNGTTVRKSMILPLDPVTPEPPTPSPTPSEEQTNNPSTPTPESSPTPSPGLPTPTPTPEQPNLGNNGQESQENNEPSIPAPPRNCAFDPAPPKILSQNRPEEPQAPIPPEGVTVPESWKDPRK